MTQTLRPEIKPTSLLEVINSEKEFYTRYISEDVDIYNQNFNCVLEFEYTENTAHQPEHTMFLALDPKFRDQYVSFMTTTQYCSKISLIHKDAKKLDFKNNNILVLNVPVKSTQMLMNYVKYGNLFDFLSYKTTMGLINIKFVVLDRFGELNA
jgi:hypothetical protein